jgi:hypothetical protein
MPISINIEPRLERRLADYCRARHTSEEAVLAQALREFLASVPETPANPLLNHPFVGGEDGGEDPEAARLSQQRLRNLMAKKAATHASE